MTGFGLLGHAWELARASDLGIEIESARVPILGGAIELVKAGVVTAADKSNREYVGNDIEIAESVGTEIKNLLYDPQTAGGLLISISPDRADALIARLRGNYPDAAIIGRAFKRDHHSIRVV